MANNRAVWIKVGITVGVILVSVSIAWATLSGTQKDIAKDVEKLDVEKLDVAIFEMYSVQQREQFKGIKEDMKNGFEHMGKALEKIEKKL